MIDLDGHTFIMATEAPEHLGDDVTAGMVRLWRHRRLITGYRVGRQTWYDLDALIEVEWVLRSAGRGRPRRAA